MIMQHENTNLEENEEKNLTDRVR